MLAKLGADVRSAGAIGTDAARRHAARAARARRRRHLAAACAATTCRPRRACCRSAPTASRPAFHVVGANGTYGPDDVDVGRDRAARRTCTSAGPEFMGGEAAAKILVAARASTA